jgi:hypothetical protein
MRIKTSNGIIMESANDLVIEQWRKAGYEEVTEKKPSTKKKDAAEKTAE